MAENPIQESWNMATATLQRLNWLLNQSSILAQSGNLIGWFQVLMDLRRNLHPFMEEKDFKEAEEKLRALPEKWKYYGKVSPANYPIVNEILDKVFIIFIDTMKNKGLLMPKPIDVRKSVIEM